MRLIQMLNKDELKKEISEKLMIITKEKNNIYYDFFQKVPQKEHMYTQIIKAITMWLVNVDKKVFIK